MDKKTINLDENAKNDWFKIVNKHKKRQKGLPALSTLNTNAGNVEKSIELFNMMQPSASVSVDASNGNVDAGGMSESIQMENKKMDKIILHYASLPVEIVTRPGKPGGYYDYGMGQWYPDEGDKDLTYVPWDYKVDKSDIVEVLQELPEVEAEFALDNIPEEDFDATLQSRFDSLFGKYKDKVMDELYDHAVEAAQRYYDEEVYESVEKTGDPVKSLKEEILDDTFDMSMRTLL